MRAVYTVLALLALAGCSSTMDPAREYAAKNCEIMVKNKNGEIQCAYWQWGPSLDQARRSKYHITNVPVFVPGMLTK